MRSRRSRTEVTLQIMIAAGIVGVAAWMVHRRFEAIEIDRAGSGSERMVKPLLGAHATVNLRSGEGKTALGYAKSYRHRSIVKLLLLNGGIE